VKRYIVNLSATAEFMIVIVVAFGYMLIASFLAIIEPNPEPPISPARLWSLIVFESTILVTLSWILRLRGWTLQVLGLAPSVRETFAGLGLAVAAYAATLVTWTIVESVGPGLVQSARQTYLVSPGLNVVTVVAVATVNPVFEEVFVCGYIVAALRRNGQLWTGVISSVGLRLFYHLYQGAGAISILPIGLLFAFCYAWSGRLWPVIVAHAIVDVFGLIQYVGD
jgi:membrane protease YdiL (CAAX protease family)